jgi:hypothetical protein
VQQATISAQEVALLRLQLTGTTAAIEAMDLRAREAELLATIAALGSAPQQAITLEAVTEAASPPPRSTLLPTSTPVVTVAVGNRVDLVRVVSPGLITSEAVELRSKVGDIDLTGWVMEDSNGNRYTFPAATLRDGMILSVYSGVGEDTETALYWGRDEAVWNRSGDMLILRASDGSIAVRATIFERR